MADSHHFAVVPYVQCQKPLKIGPFRLWPNTAENWHKYLGCPPPHLMQIYRDETGRERGKRASVLTTELLEEPSQWAWIANNAITAFSTLAWFHEHVQWGADCWYADVWSTREGPPSGTSLMRTGKYFRNFSDSTVERVRPTPYTRPLTLSSSLWPDEPLLSVTIGLGNPETLAAFRNLHRARLASPLYRNEEDDAEAIWAAFEGLFPHNTTRATHLQARKAAGEKRIKADTLISDALLAEVGEKDPRVEQGVRSILRALYKARNPRAHGSRVPSSSLFFAPLNIDLVRIALELARSVLLLRAWSSNWLMTENAWAPIRDPFVARPAIERVVRGLAKCSTKKRPKALPGLSAEVNDAVSFSAFERIQSLKIDPARLMKARRAALFVVSDWLAAHPGATGVYEFTCAIGQVSDKISRENALCEVLNSIGWPESGDSEWDLLHHGIHAGKWARLCLVLDGLLRGSVYAPH